MFLKKFLSLWFMPLPLCLVLLAVGAWLAWRPGREKAGRMLWGAGLLLLLFFSNRAVSAALIGPLESRFPAVPEFVPGQPLPEGLRHCGTIAVLGAGNGDVPGLPALSELSPSGLSRLIEAIRLSRALPGATLILSGPANPPYPSHAQVLAEAAVSLGVPPGRIRLLDTAHDTEEEIAAIKRMSGGARVALVTSAWHMPRAMALVVRDGLEAYPCPTDYASRPDPGFHWTDLGWDLPSLERSTAAVHERLGMLWLSLKSFRG